MICLYIYIVCGSKYFSQSLSKIFFLCHYTADEYGAAWSCRFQTYWEIEEWRDSYRLGFDSDPNASEAWCRREVRRVLW